MLHGEPGAEISLENTVAKDYLSLIAVSARVCLVASVVSGFVIVPELLAATSI